MYRFRVQFGNTCTSKFFKGERSLKNLRDYMFFRQIVQETIVLVTVLITYMKKFSILIGWEQCSFEEIQCRK